MSPYSLMTELAACLSITLDDANRSPCTVDVQPGDAIAPDSSGCNGGKCGQGWVRLGLAYPSSTVGQPVQTPRNCGVGLGLDLEVGVLRCYSVDREGRPIDLAKMSDGQVQDMLLTREAISCCDALDEGDYILGTYSPIGPQGGVLGGSWVLHVGLL